MSTQTASVSLDSEYLKSRQGLLRIGEAAIGLCGIICESHGAYCGFGGYDDMYSFYNFVVVASLILALIILIMYALQLDKLCTFNWFPLVFLNDVLFAILYLIATILMIVTIGACTYGQVARIFATLFGVCGTVVVGMLALFGYQVMKDYQSLPTAAPGYQSVPDPGYQSVPNSDLGYQSAPISNPA